MAPLNDEMTTDLTDLSTSIGALHRYTLEEEQEQAKQLKEIEKRKVFNTIERFISILNNYGNWELRGMLVEILSSDHVVELQKQLIGKGEEDVTTQSNNATNTPTEETASVITSVSLNDTDSNKSSRKDSDLSISKRSRSKDPAKEKVRQSILGNGSTHVSRRKRSTSKKRRPRSLSNDLKRTNSSTDSLTNSEKERHQAIFAQRRSHAKDKTANHNSTFLLPISTSRKPRSSRNNCRSRTPPRKSSSSPSRKLNFGVGGMSRHKMPTRTRSNEGLRSMATSIQTNTSTSHGSQNGRNTSIRRHRIPLTHLGSSTHTPSTSKSRPMRGLQRSTSMRCRVENTTSKKQSTLFPSTIADKANGIDADADADVEVDPSPSNLQVKNDQGSDDESSYNDDGDDDEEEEKNQNNANMFLQFQPGDGDDSEVEMGHDHVKSCRNVMTLDGLISDLNNSRHEPIVIPAAPENPKKAKKKGFATLFGSRHSKNDKKSPNAPTSRKSQCDSSSSPTDANSGYGSNNIRSTDERHDNAGEEDAQNSSDSETASFAAEDDIDNQSDLEL